MHRGFLLLALVLAHSVAGCSAGYQSKIPAANGVRDLISALRGDDPRQAYELLSAQVRARVSYEEWAAQWQASAPERRWQATALEESLRGSPDAGERAVIGVGDGRTVPLDREGDRWQLEAALVTRSHAPRPRDAIRIFAEAVADRDVDGALGILTKRRREGLGRQVAGFLQGLGKRADETIDEYGTDRAELRWDEGGIRYRIMLRKEDEEWRIDDISIRVVATESEEPAAGVEEE